MTLSIGGLFLILDRWFKHMSIWSWADKGLINNFFGWFPLHNTGIAFGLPVPVWISITLTIPIIVFLTFFFFKSLLSISNFPISQMALFLILLGALSNFYDRIVYHGTLDYFLILTSIINLADVMIVGGFVLLLMANARKKMTREMT